MTIGSSSAGRSGVSALIGVSSSIARVRKHAQWAAGHGRSLLLAGPAGTGKELIAKAIHQVSDRSRAPFVRFDCAAGAERISASQLVGHTAGAIPGVIGASLGCMRAAHGGTLFLKNIDALTVTLQQRVLRLLRYGVVVPIGAFEAHKVDVRIVASTRVDLETEVDRKQFLAQLYENLRRDTLFTEPLAERPEDIAVLAEEFLNDMARRHGLPRAHLTSGALELLITDEWPGNVRQLRHVVEDAAIHCRYQEITADAIDAALEKSRQLGSLFLSLPDDWLDLDGGDSFLEVDAEPWSRSAGEMPMDDWLSLDDAERKHILATLRRARFDVGVAAQLLGIEEADLRRRVVRHGIDLSSPPRD